jgi:hypothetical protein
MNNLMIMEDPSNEGFYIAVYTGETGEGEQVKEEEAHNIKGENKEGIIINAAVIWGIDLDDCNIDFTLDLIKQ